MYAKLIIAMDGFILIDKEKGMTSFGVVKRVRYLSKEKKVGHSGTLDPLATGLLIIALGRCTKSLTNLIGCDKEYEVIAKFGYVSNTYDGEGEIKASGFKNKYKRSDIAEVIKKSFLGEIEQMPPIYSAKKIKGVRAYNLARQGKEVILKPKKIKVNLFEIEKFSWPEVKFKIKCGSGCYVRSLIHDLGQKLKVGAYVQELRRTKINDFSVVNARKLDELNENIEQEIIPIEEMAKKIEFMLR